MAQTLSFATHLFTDSCSWCPFDPVALHRAMAAEDADLDDDEADEDDEDEDDEDEDDEDEDDEDQEDEDDDQEEDGAEDDAEYEEDDDLDDEDAGDEARTARSPFRRQNGHAAPMVRPQRGR
jgi:hypothetical protein